MKKCILFFALAFFAASLTLTSCDSAVEQADTRKEIVVAISNNVILPIYRNLETNGASLLAAINALKNDPTSPAKLEAAKTAWIATRSPFETGEAFEFGPLVDNSIKRDVDAWPIDVQALDSIIASSFVITEANVGALPQNVRGDHMVEFFLWGDAENSIPPKLGSRELEFLYVMTKVTIAKFTLLRQTWEDSYFKTFTERPPLDALKEHAEALTDIAEELGNDYLLDPINKPEGPRGWAESFYANNSTQDFTDIITGVRAVYLGDFSGVSGKGLTDFIAEKDAALDSTIKQQIEAAYNAIVAIGNDFNGVAKTNPGVIRTASDRCIDLYRTLDEDLVRKEDWWK